MLVEDGEEGMRERGVKIEIEDEQDEMRDRSDD